MKKLLSILLTVCMCLASCVMFISCNEENETASDTTAETQTAPISQASTEETTEATTEATTENEPASGGISEEKWDNMIQTANFDNITFSYDATFTAGSYLGDLGPHRDIFKLVDNCIIDQDGDVEDDPETIEAFKNWYIGSALAIADNFDKFVYDATNDCYNATEDIVYPLSIMEYDAMITASNTMIQLDDDLHIAKIVCKMTQEFEENGTQKVFILDVTFQFSNYGTTVA